MTLANYTGLVSVVESRIARTDLTAQYQDWVTTAELTIVRELRVAEMDKVNTALTGTSGKLALPSDFLEMNEVRLGTDLSIELHFEPRKMLFRREQHSVEDGSGYWTIIGTDLYVRPIPSDTQTYWVDYIAKPAALTDTTQEVNSLFPGHADMYLYGTLWQAYNYVRAFDKADRELQLMKSAIQIANAQTIREGQGTQGLRMDAPVMA